MNIDVRSEHDLDRYEQLFDNPVLDTLFGVAQGTGLFLQFCDSHSAACIGSSCFAALLEVRDFNTAAAAQAAGPDPGAAPPALPAEAAGGDGDIT